MFYFFFTLYIYYNNFFQKNQRNPPFGKPQSTIRVAGGYISGKKLFFIRPAFMRGHFPVEMMCKFPVSVAVQCDFRKYKVKHTRFPQIRGEILRFTPFYFVSLAKRVNFHCFLLE